MERKLQTANTQDGKSQPRPTGYFQKLVQQKRWEWTSEGERKEEILEMHTVTGIQQQQLTMSSTAATPFVYLN